ncbi:hypothetical protein AK812_SmicGene30877 [Symbiodinium microadriaticum]|uniref:Uncharacterized protein n=1 Tax=Symbiodinium microadriaticum TaxID=2951 RepID=A0A1Q9CY55_SYMMI|nr:hypothetical protein AK812_SmicGene30877 [Symbiodinium microadriaticum]
MAGDVSPIVAEMQGRARSAYNLTRPWSVALHSGDAQPGSVAGSQRWITASDRLRMSRSSASSPSHEPVDLHCACVMAAQKMCAECGPQGLRLGLFVRVGPGLHEHTRALNEETKLLTALVRQHFPGSPFLTIALFKDPDFGPHKDMQNSWLPNLIVELLPSHGGGTWVGDFALEDAEGTLRWGTLLSGDQYQAETSNCRASDYALMLEARTRGAVCSSAQPIDDCITCPQMQGRAVILLLAMAGNFFIWKRTATPATPTAANSGLTSSDDDSDLPLAPPEDDGTSRMPLENLGYPNHEDPGTGLHDRQVPGGPHQLYARPNAPLQQTLPASQPQLPSDLHNRSNQQQYFEPWSAWDDVDYDTGNNFPQATYHAAGTGQQQYRQATRQPNAAVYVPPTPATRIGFATTYDPDSDPWHDSGHLDDEELGRRPASDEGAHPQISPITSSNIIDNHHPVMKPTDNTPYIHLAIWIPKHKTNSGHRNRIKKDEPYKTSLNFKQAIPTAIRMDEDMDWISDVSDTEEEEDDPDRAKLASLLAAHQYERDSVWRKPTDSTTLQLKFDGTSRRPIRVVDNRPEHPRTGGDPNDNTNRAQEEHMEGDVLFVQPTHLTASSSASSSDNTPPGAPQPTIDDLEEQARQAVREGRAPQWDIEDATSSMRSSIRIGDVSFDLSWLQGAGPPTLPPTIPIARNVVFTARASLAGAWRGRDGLHNFYHDHNDNRPPTTAPARDSQPSRGDPPAAWITEPTPQTPVDLLQALTKVVHELLQASFNQPNELVTTLAYRACNYITEMHAGGPLPQQPQAADLGITLDPTTTIFALDNPIIEVEATLVHMLQNHREMPRRHLSKEASRLEQLLKDAKQVLTAWGRDPNAPGAHEGVASIRNTIDALDWFHLAVEEGGVAQMEETLEQALQAIHRVKPRHKIRGTNGSEFYLKHKKDYLNEIPVNYPLFLNHLIDMIMIRAKGAAHATRKWRSILPKLTVYWNVGRHRFGVTRSNSWTRPLRSTWIRGQNPCLRFQNKVVKTRRGAKQNRCSSMVPASPSLIGGEQHTERKIWGADSGHNLIDVADYKRRLQARAHLSGIPLAERGLEFPEYF